MSGGPISTIRAALHYWERRQEVMSHNLANTSTDGFKAERVFSRLLDNATLEAGSQTDFQAGALARTDRPLDVGLVGDGFLVIQTERGLRYTRGGSLSLDTSGTLVDLSGNPVLGRRGPIVLPDGVVQIDQNGDVKVDGAVIDNLRLERAPENSGKMMREGGLYFVPNGSGVRIREGEVAVHQGQLEQSNVNPIDALVEMLDVQRAYSALQRTAQTIDGVMQTVSRDLGRLR